MKKIFDIGTETEEDISGYSLLIETGIQHAALAIMNADKLVERYVCYSGDSGEELFLADMLVQHPEFRKPFRQVLISYYIKDTVQVPAALYKYEDEKLYASVFGNGGGVSKSDHLADEQIYNLYFVPKELNKLISVNFLSGKYWHYYSVLLRNKPAAGDDLLFADFKQGEFAVLYLKKGKPVFCQTWPYNTPEDVLYYLVKSTDLLGVRRAGVPLVVSGFMEKQSSLYLELYKYFNQIEFEDGAGDIRLSDDFRLHPGYYFSSVCKLAACG